MYMICSCIYVYEYMCLYVYCACTYRCIYSYVNYIHVYMCTCIIYVDKAHYQAKIDVLEGHVDKAALTIFTSRPQAELQEVSDRQRLAALKNHASVNSRDRIEAVRRPRAGAWLTVFPRKALGLWMPQREFVTAMQLWLGLANRNDEAALRKVGAGMHGRHHAIRDILFEAGKVADMRPWKEVAVDAGGCRPADIYFPDYSYGRPLSVDVTISHPSQSHTTQRARGEVSASEQAALDKYVAKQRLYSGLCEANGVDFLPLPICAYGGCLGMTDELLNTIAGRIDEKLGLQKCVTLTQLSQRLSVALWRGNARMMLPRVPSAGAGHWTCLAQTRS